MWKSCDMLISKFDPLCVSTCSRLNWPKKGLRQNNFTVSIGCEESAIFLWGRNEKCAQIGLITPNYIDILSKMHATMPHHSRRITASIG